MEMMLTLGTVDAVEVNPYPWSSDIKQLRRSAEPSQDRGNPQSYLSCRHVQIVAMQASALPYIPVIEACPFRPLITLLREQPSLASRDIMASLLSSTYNNSVLALPLYYGLCLYPHFHVSPSRGLSNIQCRYRIPSSHVCDPRVNHS